MARKTKRDQRLAALAEVANELDGWEQGRDVLTPVRSVPTIFPQFDIATRVAGLPIQRVLMVHGPSNHGKTVFMLGLGRSFLEREHFYFHIDAEFTTPEPWVVEMLRSYSSYPTFRALRPSGYEDTAEKVRNACNTIVAAREAGRIPRDTTALFGLDSLQKLVPKGFMERLLKEGGIDPAKGRGGMLQAALNSSWMKELVPLMYHANAGIVLLSRESENTEGGMFDPKYKVTGGRAPYYDSSLVCRITRNGWIKMGSGDNEKVIGERHLVQIMKTKVGHKDAKVTRCFFHTSNGQHIPAGFDTARDVLDMALDAKVVTKAKGARIVDKETGEVYGQMNAAVKVLTEQPETLRDLWGRTLAVASPVEEVAVADQ